MLVWLNSYRNVYSSFVEFIRFLRCGPGFDFFVDFLVFVKDCGFIIQNLFLMSFIYDLKLFWLDLSLLEIVSLEKFILE